MFTTKETKTATSIIQTGDARPYKVRNLMNSILDVFLSEKERIKTTFTRTEKEISITFVNDGVLGTFHVQEIGQKPIPDAIQLSLPFAQEGGMK